MVAVIKQVPEVDAVIVALLVELERAHPVAVPDVTEYVMAPVPDDPVVDIASTCENG